MNEQWKIQYEIEIERHFAYLRTFQQPMQATNDQYHEWMTHCTRQRLRFILSTFLFGAC